MALDLAFETVGSGPALVLLHGLFGSRSNWRRVARELAATHTVVSVDLRNHGASPWSGAMDYPAMADDVKQLIERLELERPAVLGHSMGGKTAMALALTSPELVDRLIVVDIAPVSYADTLTPFADAMRRVDLTVATGRADVQRLLGQFVPDPSVAPFLMQNLMVSGDHFDWRLNLLGISAAMSGLCAFPKELLDLRCECPTTVIAGKHSNYVVHHDGSEFLPMFPQVNVDVVENAGHWVHADQPIAFTNCIRAALSLPDTPPGGNLAGGGSPPVLWSMPKMEC
ncbi:alpha/beta hydrolase [Pandoraea terrae]|uniref:Alpha/beta hydrolase n=1 Tax=Pandoraea terrae TaxID=1537710 RepID=A0A5E4Y5E0_9BURK|nr:alpha/beta fold hydrolase [Pandoraea terrae]VVE43532.1 alpha/beta hydrolase [Pandoraea terrae]